MTSLGPIGQIAPGDLTMNVAATTASLSQLGSMFVSPDGRSFRVASAGATALVPGKLQQSAAENTAHQDCVPAATAVGATSVTVTLGASAVTANQYAGGLMIVSVTPGQGYAYLISSHPAADASATCVFTLADPIVVALTTSSNVDLVANRFSALVVNPTTATSSPAGAAISAVTANYVGFVQVGGLCALLADGTVTVGTDVVASNGTAGAVEALTGVQAIVGTAQTGIATTEYGAIDLFLQ